MKPEIKFSVAGIASVIFLLLILFPVYESRTASSAFALLVLVAILWASEALPLSATSLLIPVLAVLLDLLPVTTSFSSFSHPIIFLFMGGFVLGGVMMHHGVDQFLAQKIVKFSKENFYRSAVMVMIATSFLSWWISNTSAAVMMLPMAMGLITYIKKDPGSREAHFLILGVAYSASIGGIVSILSSPPNAIGAAIMDISFIEWFRNTILLYIISMAVLIAVMTSFFKPDKKLQEHVDNKRRPSPSLKFILVFSIIISCWLFEDLLAPAMGITSGFSSIVAVSGIIIILLAKLLSWDKILESIQWRILLLFGGGLTLGKVLETSGLGLKLAETISGVAGDLPLILFIWMITLFCIILTEFMSNTASAALLLPILASLAIKMGLEPAVLVFPATITASYGFMLPAGTPPNAIAFGTRYVKQGSMLKIGMILNLVFSIILTLYFYFMFY